MYKLRVKLKAYPDMINRCIFEESTIIKFFKTAIERRAYLDGIRQAREFAGGFTVTDMDEEERRARWCQVSETPIRG